MEEESASSRLSEGEEEGVRPLIIDLNKPFDIIDIVLKGSNAYSPLMFGAIDD